MKSYSKKFSFCMVALIVVGSHTLHAQEKKKNQTPQVSKESIPGKSIESIIAVVNGFPILRSELDHQKKQTEIELLKLGQKEDLDNPIAFEKKVFEQMIEDKLLNDEMERLQLKASDRAVEEVIVEIMNRHGIPSKQALEEELKRDGITLEQFYDNYQTRLSRNNFLEKMIRPRVKIDDEDVREEYNRRAKAGDKTFVYDLSMIFLPASSKNRKLMTSLRKKITKDQEGFSDVAGKYTEGPAKQEGGKIGKVSLNDLDQSLSQAVEKLNTNEISSIIENDKGLFLIRLNDKSVQESEDFEKLKEQIQQDLFNQGLAKQLNLYLEDLKQKSHIEKYLG
ncbi:MAG: SurA N-terminal domain-containing protein [Bdellovibrionota bacterium]